MQLIAVAGPTRSCRLPNRMPPLAQLVKTSTRTCSCSTGRPNSEKRSSPRLPSSTHGACGSARSRLFYDSWLGKLPISELERISLLFDINEIHRPAYARSKRFLDW